MKKFNTSILIVLILTSCTNQNKLRQLTQLENPALTTTSVPTETPAVSQVERLLTAYQTGEEIDVSHLSPAEFREFSTQLAERRNAERGINPVIYNNEAYISPENYMMINYDGHPDMNETIQMYLPIAGKDGMGNLQIINHDGEVVTIKNSSDVDWNMRVTDPNDQRIEWPTTKILDSGFVEAQYRVFHQDNPATLFPAILLDSAPGQIFLTGDQPVMIPNLRFLSIETDTMNNPILAREIINIGGPKFNLFEEGSSLDEESSIVELSTSRAFFVDLQVNCVYYIGGPVDQNKFYKDTMRANIGAYRGFLNPGSTYPVLMGSETNIEDMIILATSMLIKKQ